MTRVSIITPFYNIPDYETYEKSASSIEKQTCKDVEWILVDDGSEDTSWVSDIRLHSNYGPSVARNAGFQISSGDIITYLDMGDELDPNRVETLIKIRDGYNSDLIFSGYNMVEPNGLLHRFSPFLYIGNTMSAEDYLRLLKNQNISIPLGVAHTRKPFVECGGFQRGIVCGEDGVLWRRMADKLHPTSIMFSDDCAGTYYVNPKGQSRTQRRFDMGGFAINGDLMDNGRYLDNHWFEYFTSKGYYD